MHTLRTALFTPLLLTLACSPSDSGTAGTGTTSAATETTGHASHETAGSTAEPTTSGTSGDVHATHETGATEDTGATHGTEDTGHTQDTGHTGDTEDTSDTHDTHEGLTTGGDSSPFTAYCDCMLEHCHDQYHALWGEDHRAAEVMCHDYAEAVPSVGMPAMSGDSIECRLHFCELGHDDAAACESALGGDPCK